MCVSFLPLLSKSAQYQLSCFYFVPWYFSVTSFCLILCFYFCAFGRLVTFPNRREVSPLFSSPELHALGLSSMWAAQPFCCGRVTTVGAQIDIANKMYNLEKNRQTPRNIHSSKTESYSCKSSKMFEWRWYRREMSNPAGSCLMFGIDSM